MLPKGHREPTIIGKVIITFVFWNMFDQVLIRPELLDRFCNEDLEILETDGKKSLVNPSKTPRKKISDHLPILFRLSL